jgi:hypothetical protein
MTTTSGGLSTLESDFSVFSKLYNSAISAQSVGDGAGAPTGARPELQQLNAAMAQYGLLPQGQGGAAAGAVQAQWGFSDLTSFLKGAVNTGRQIYNVGHGLGLFEATTDVEMQFLETFLRGQVSDLIQKLHDYVNQYSQLTECVPLVTSTVQQFGQGQYAKALASGYQAYNCIRSKL